MADRDVARDETVTLIASDKVEGTAVFNLKGERLGAIHNFMVDKESGQVRYAVMSFGGMLGMGNDFYPLPWESLAYDPAQRGYVISIDIDKDMLKAAPHYTRTTDEPTYDPAYRDAIYGHYGLSGPRV